MKKLYLSNDDSKLSGVCGGIAEYLNIDSTVIRLLWIIFTLATGLIGGIVAYLLALMIIPRQQ